MRVHYLEIVTTEVEAVCAAYSCGERGAVRHT